MFEEEYEEYDDTDNFTSADDEMIDEQQIEMAIKKRFDYTYKLIEQEGGKAVFQAIEDDHYKIHINYTSMSSGYEYTKE